MSPSKFLGPLPSGEYLLVIVDYFSRYKEIEIMKRITAEETTCRLHTIFTRLGYPVTITLDNARQFISTHFDEYCKLHGIQLNYSTPYAGEWFGGTPEPFTPQAIADQPCHGTELERRFERLFDDVLHKPSCDDRKNPYGTMLWQDDQVEDPLYHRHRIDPQHG